VAHAGPAPLAGKLPAVVKGESMEIKIEMTFERLEAFFEMMNYTDLSPSTKMIIAAIKEGIEATTLSKPIGYKYYWNTGGSLAEANVGIPLQLDNILTKANEFNPSKYQMPSMVFGDKNILSDYCESYDKCLEKEKEDNE
jgi:hypothetical protein